MTLMRTAMAGLLGLALMLADARAVAQDASEGITLTVGGADRSAIVVNAAPKGERRPAVIVGTWFTCAGSTMVDMVSSTSLSANSPFMCASQVSRRARWRGERPSPGVVAQAARDTSAVTARGAKVRMDRGYSRRARGGMQAR